MGEDKRQVIIGNGAAGLSAIKAIRGIGSTCSITLISAENCNAYSPALITYYISGKIGKDNLFVVNDKFYRDYNVKTILGNKAVRIDPPNQMAYLEDGNKVEYDNLLIATGASPRHLDNIDVNLSQRVLTLRTIEDAEKIMKLNENVNEVIFLGAGLVSLQVASAIYRKGTQFTFIVGSKQVLSQNIDADCAAIVQKEIESWGVSFLLGRSVKEIERKGDRLVVILDSGEELRAGMVIVGKGVDANVQLIKNSSVKVKKGILVDESMRTNIENIFAAGDVAEGKNLVTGENDVLQTWLNACEQGRIAGLNMAGYPRSSGGALNANITHIFGLTIATIGLSKSSNGCLVEELKFSDPRQRIYRKVIFDKNRIVGAVLLGRVDDAGLIRSLIENSTNISSLKYGTAKNLFNLGKIFFPTMKY